MARSSASTLAALRNNGVDVRRILIAATAITGRHDRGAERVPGAVRQRARGWRVAKRDRRRRGRRGARPAPPDVQHGGGRAATARPPAAPRPAPAAAAVPAAALAAVRRAGVPAVLAAAAWPRARAAQARRPVPTLRFAPP